MTQIGSRDSIESYLYSPAENVQFLQEFVALSISIS